MVIIRNLTCFNNIDKPSLEMCQRFTLFYIKTERRKTIKLERGYTEIIWRLEFSQAGSPLT